MQLYIEQIPLFFPKIPPATPSLDSCPFILILPVLIQFLIVPVALKLTIPPPYEPAFM